MRGYIGLSMLAVAIAVGLGRCLRCVSLAAGLRTDRNGCADAQPDAGPDTSGRPDPARDVPSRLRHVHAAGPDGPAFDSRTILKGNANPPNGMAVALWQNIGTVYNDPCHAGSPSPGPTGLTVDALVAAFVAQKRGSPVTPVDVTVDGFACGSRPHGAARRHRRRLRRWPVQVVDRHVRGRPLQPGSRPARPARHPRGQRQDAGDPAVLLPGQRPAGTGELGRSVRLHPRSTTSVPPGSASRRTSVTAEVRPRTR